MSKCANCGAENEPAAGRCAYCDGALQASSSLQVAWLARSPEGIQGEGRIELIAGGGVTTAQVRSAAESAFTAAVGALGPQAKGQDVQQRMTQELPRLLPAGVEIHDLSMTAYRRKGAAAPTAAASGGGGRSVLGILVPLIGLAMSMCCLGSGLLMVVAGETTALRLKQVQAAKVVPSLDDATGQDVCLEGVSAASGSDAVELTFENGDVERLLYVSGSSVSRDSKGKDHKRAGSPGYSDHVDRIILTDGALVTVSASTEWSGLEHLGIAEVDGHRWNLRGVRVSAPVLTVVGTEQKGNLAATEISTDPTRAKLIDRLTGQRYAGDVGGIVCAGAGGLVALGCLAVLFRRRKR